MPVAETFQHYEVLKNPDGSFCELGRGAMGVTYKAFDTSLRSLVALKVINAASLDSEVARQRFQREARAAAGLHHPNVAGVFHLGEEGGNFFYAMEFIEGETIDAFVRRRGPLPAALALNLTLQVTRALRAAAKVGLVHRDIKPANLMLSREDEDDADDELHVKVIDFGLAKITRAEGGDASASITGPGIVGTPHFISPEQLEEKPLDSRSDIYSLGATLWFMLVGKPPFSGSLMQIMSKHLTEPPPFTELQGQPAVVSDLLRHMLAKDPAQRPQTPSELRREIEAALRTLGAPAGDGTLGAESSSPGGHAADETSAGGTDGRDASGPAADRLVAPASASAPNGRDLAASVASASSAVRAAGAELPPPVHIVTHQLTPRGVQSAAAATRPRRANRRTGVVIFAGVALLAMAAAGFVAWKQLHVASPPAGTTAGSPHVEAATAQTPAPQASAPQAAPAASASAEATLERGLVDARALASSGAIVDALLAYTRLQDEYPESPQVRRGRETSVVALRATQDFPNDIRQPLSAAEQARFTKVRAAVERLADEGFRPAMLYLGDHLILTESTAAIEWFSKAAALGEPEAMHQLGNMYSRGFGTGTGTADYAHWFQEAADRGYPRAKIWLADCYSRGRGGVAKDPAKAFQLLKEAQQSEPNNPKLLVNLGFAYAYGYGTPADPTQGFVLMQRATEEDAAQAWGDLGNFYMTGVGTPKDPVKAVDCYRRGAELKDAPAMFHYALCLEKSLGTPKDAPAALAMMRQAMEAGYPDAVGYLGTYYMAGIGMDKPDPAMAASLYKDGAARRDALCEFRYAQCLESGNGVPADKELAAKFYAASAEQNYKPAQGWIEQHKAASPKK